MSVDRGQHSRRKVGHQALAGAYGVVFGRVPYDFQRGNFEPNRRAAAAISYNLTGPHIRRTCARSDRKSSTASISASAAGPIRQGLDCRSAEPLSGRLELRGIGDTPAPGLPAAEPICSRRFPQHGGAAIHDRAHEVPLVAAEPARPRNHDALIQASELNAEPTLPGARHVGADGTARNNLARIGIGPLNVGRPPSQAGPNEARSP
jgi:hypothetical protein